MTEQTLQPQGPSVAKTFWHICERVPGQLAVIQGSQRLTYAQMKQRALSWCQALMESDLQLGDRVIVAMDDAAELTAVLIACWTVGMVGVPLPHQTRPDRLHFVLEDTGAQAVVADADVITCLAADRLQTALPPMLWVCEGNTDLAPLDAALVPPQRPWPNACDVDSGVANVAMSHVLDNALATLIYTSGSTGVPKGVMLSHANMRAAWQSVQSYLQLRPEDIIGLPLSPVYSYGLYHLLMGLSMGATVVAERQAAFPIKLVQRWREEGVTVVPGVPTLFATLLGLRASDTELPALRLLTNAAAALPHAHLLQVRQRWPQARFLAMYGLTECKRASWLDADEAEARPGSVGRGLAQQRHWIVDEQGQPVPPGSVGELVVAGPHVMQGYWNRPESTADRLRVGPDGDPRTLYTGDLFRSDADGYLYYVGRIDDMIKSGGEKVSPVEVEQVLCAHPDIAEAVVVGLNDERLGQAVAAFVIRKTECDHLSERDVTRHCRTHLDPHQVPRLVRFVTEWPTTTSGKVLRRQLAADALEGSQLS